jgi:uncharacterized LabA/DUF88 family protein
MNSETLMRKVMLFIDGSWLSRTLHDKSASRQDAWRIDYGKLPGLLVEAVGKQIGSTDLDLVRVHYFSSYATNVDPRDEEHSGKQLHFQNILRDQFGFELDLYAIDFHGKRLRAQDRDSEDTFRPKEKCVDIAVAASMLYYTAIPNAMDIAIVITGDRDFQPVMRATRMLGKRVALASMRNSCSNSFRDPDESAAFLDYPVIWIEDFEDRIRLGARSKSASHPKPKPAPPRVTPKSKKAEATPETQTSETQTTDIDNDAEFKDSVLRNAQFGSYVSLSKDTDGNPVGHINCPGVGVFHFGENDLYHGVKWNQLRTGHRLRFRCGRIPDGDQEGLAWEVRPAVRL